jgi:hypothetical protein
VPSPSSTRAHRIGQSGAVTFSFQFETHGVRRRVVFEERGDADGARLVVTHMEGEFSDDEIERIYADALAKWMHAIETPDDWFE